MSKSVIEAVRNLAIVCDHFHTLYTNPPKWTDSEIERRRNEIVADMRECIEELRESQAEGRAE